MRAGRDRLALATDHAGGCDGVEMRGVNGRLGETEKKAALADRLFKKKDLPAAYWQASQSPPFSSASREQAFFSASVYSRVS